MKKELNYYNFDLSAALEKEFAGKQNYEAMKIAEKEYERRIVEWRERHPTANAQRVKGKKYQWRKSLFANIKFDYNYRELEKKYRVLKRTIIVDVDGRKLKNSQFCSMLYSQADFRAEMGHNFVLIDSFGREAPILQIINY